MFFGVAANGFLADVEWLPQPLAPWWWPCLPAPLAPWWPLWLLLWLLLLLARSDPASESEPLLGLAWPCCLPSQAAEPAGAPADWHADPLRCLLGNLAAMAGLLMALPSRMQACACAEVVDQTSEKTQGSVCVGC